MMHRGGKTKRGGVSPRFLTKETCPPRTRLDQFIIDTDLNAICFLNTGVGGRKKARRNGTRKPNPSELSSPIGSRRSATKKNTESNGKETRET